MQAGLATAIHAAGYAGPQVFFSIAEGAVEVQPRSLQEVVADWLEAEPSVMAAWQCFEQERGVPEYARFLDRLSRTVSSSDQEFRRRTVINDLRQAAENSNLREQYFDLALDASETCEDRVTLTWNAMQNARMIEDVKNGVYDNDGRLADLIDLGRVMFRLDALERIARKKVESLQAELQLIGDEDAERLLGPDISNEIASEIKGGLMRQVLTERGLQL
ncbi:hypothetical protein ACVIWU_006932 [Bradyrhizobium sp. USDA 4509]